MSRDILISALWDGIKLLLGAILVFSSTLFTSDFLTETIEALKDYKIYITIITTSAGLLIFMYLYQLLRKHKPWYPNLDFDFRIVEKEISLNFANEGNIIYKKRSYLKALKKNLDAYHDKYHWTGSKENSVKSNIKGQKFQKTLRKNIFQLYEILFQHTLKKGEMIETELIWDLKDTSSKMVPFISATIHEPTDLLVLNISFNEGQKVENVICEVTSSIGANKVFETNKLEVDRNGEAIWRIRNPKLLYHYEMRWFY